MPLPELSLPSWLGPGEPAGAPMLRGAQAGASMVNSFLAARQQKTREQAVAQEIATQQIHNRMMQQQLQEAAGKYANEMRIRDGRAALAHVMGQIDWNKPEDRELVWKTAANYPYPEIMAEAKNIESTLFRAHDEAEAQGSLSVLNDRIRRARTLGLDNPVAQQGVVDWVQANRGLLTLPAGKALWEDYLQSVDEDRKHKAQLENFQAQSEERMGVAAVTAGATEQRQLEMERFRQENRVALEDMREKLRRELDATPPNAPLVTEEAWVNRHINAMAGGSLVGETMAERKARFREADAALRDLYREARGHTNAPVAAPKPAAPSAAVGVRLRRKSDGAEFLYKGNAADVPTAEYEVLP